MLLLVAEQNQMQGWHYGKGLIYVMANLSAYKISPSPEKW